MYRVFIIDPWTGRIYNPNGTRFDRGKDEAYFEKPHASIERAKTFCRGVVRRYPNLACSVLDEANSEVWRHQDSEWLKQVAEERKFFAEIHAKEQKRGRFILLGGLVAFALIISTVSSIIMAMGLDIWLAIIISCVIASLLWLIIVALS